MNTLWKFMSKVRKSIQKPENDTTEKNASSENLSENASGNISNTRLKTGTNKELKIKTTEKDVHDMSFNNEAASSTKENTNENIEKTAYTVDMLKKLPHFTDLSITQVNSNSQSIPFVNTANYLTEEKVEETQELVNHHSQVTEYVTIVNLEEILKRKATDSNVTNNEEIGRKISDTQETLHTETVNEKTIKCLKEFDAIFAKVAREGFEAPNDSSLLEGIDDLLEEKLDMDSSWNFQEITSINTSGGSNLSIPNDPVTGHTLEINTMSSQDKGDSRIVINDNSDVILIDSDSENEVKNDCTHSDCFQADTTKNGTDVVVTEAVTKETSYLLQSNNTHFEDSLIAEEDNESRKIKDQLNSQCEIPTETIIETIWIRSEDNIETNSNKSDHRHESDDCGYHSSDFEFITEEEAKTDGLIINFNPQKYTSQDSKDMSRPKTVTYKPRKVQKKMNKSKPSSKKLIHPGNRFQRFHLENLDPQATYSGNSRHSLRNMTLTSRLTNPEPSIFIDSGVISSIPRPSSTNASPPSNSGSLRMPRPLRNSAPSTISTIQTPELSARYSELSGIPQLRSIRSSITPVISENLEQSNTPADKINYLPRPSSINLGQSDNARPIKITGPFLKGFGPSNSSLGISVSPLNIPRLSLDIPGSSKIPRPSEIPGPSSQIPGPSSEIPGPSLEILGPTSEIPGPTLETPRPSSDIPCTSSGFPGPLPGFMNPIDNPRYFDNRDNGTVIADKSYMENYVVPDENDMIEMFERRPRLLISEIRFLENKSIATQGPMLEQYEGVGFDMNWFIQQNDSSDEEHRDDAEDVRGIILEKYPHENVGVPKRRRRH